MRTNFVAATVTPVWLHFGPNRVRSIEGYNPSADAFIQLFDLPSAANSPIATGAIPQESLQIQGSNSFKWEFVDGLDFSKDLSIAVSTTQATYTPPAAGQGANFSVIHDGPYPVLASNGAGYTVSDTGDYSTLIKNLLVWSEATGAASGKILRRVDVRTNVNALYYVVGYARDRANIDQFDKQLFILPIPAAKNGVDLQFHAGKGNFPIMGANSATKVMYQGLTLLLATDTAPGSIASGADAVMRAIFTDVV